MMDGLLKSLGVFFIFVLMLSPFIVMAIYNNGRADGINWATTQIYGPRS